MESIGDILRNERERRGLTLQEVNEASKITIQNLTALEENRFDFFPNRVYARAFLRDYSNFLGLDSAALLARYEDEWNKTIEGEVVEPKKCPLLRALAYIAIFLIIAAGLGYAGYYGWTSLEKKQVVPRVKRVSSGNASLPPGATLPPAPDVKLPEPTKQAKTPETTKKEVESPSQQSRTN